MGRAVYVRNTDAIEKIINAYGPCPIGSGDLHLGSQGNHDSRMVIGGIAVDNANKTRNGVPWLADIPLLGYLFRRDTDTKTRTTLYFFVTPHIMRDREFADLSEFSFRKKLEAADAIGTERVQIVDPKFGTDTEELDLRGFDVPLYQSPTRGEVDDDDVDFDVQKINELLENAENDNR